MASEVNELDEVLDARVRAERMEASLTLVHDLKLALKRCHDCFELACENSEIVAAEGARGVSQSIIRAVASSGGQQRWERGGESACT